MVVRLHHPVGVGDAGLGRRRIVVDHVAAEGGDLAAADVLGRRRPCLGELAGDPPDLHHRKRGSVGEHRGHLQQDLELLADVHRREVVEGLGALAGLKQEGASGGGLGKRSPKLAGLAREDERRHDREPRAGGLGALLARPVRLVERRLRAPGGGRPDGLRNRHGHQCSEG